LHAYVPGLKIQGIKLANEICMSQVDAGQAAGLEVILRTLISSHPNPEIFRREFTHEYRAKLGVLLMQGASSEVMDAYREFLGGVLPDVPMPDGEQVSERS
jgi:hypothetical protein